MLNCIKKTKLLRKKTTNILNIIEHLNPIQFISFSYKIEPNIFSAMSSPAWNGVIYNQNIYYLPPHRLNTNIRLGGLFQYKPVANASFKYFTYVHQQMFSSHVDSLQIIC